MSVRVTSALSVLVVSLSLSACHSKGNVEAIRNVPSTQEQLRNQIQSNLDKFQKSGSAAPAGRELSAPIAQEGQNKIQYKNPSFPRDCSQCEDLAKAFDAFVGNEFKFNDRLKALPKMKVLN